MKFKFLQPPTASELAERELPGLRRDLYDADREAAKVKANIGYFEQRIAQLEALVHSTRKSHA